MTGVADLDNRLQELHVRTRETPLFNPVFQLGLELSRQLESGEMNLDQIEALVAELECEGLRAALGAADPPAGADRHGRERGAAAGALGRGGIRRVRRSLAASAGPRRVHRSPDVPF